MTTSMVDNGVDIEALRGAREAVTDTPELAQFTWRSTVKWVNGTHSRSEIQSFYGLNDEQSHHTSFTLDADHPEQFAATDVGATPVEYVLVALGSCLTGGIATIATQRNIQLRSVQATLTDSSYRPKSRVVERLVQRYFEPLTSISPLPV